MQERRERGPVRLRRAQFPQPLVDRVRQFAMILPHLVEQVRDLRRKVPMQFRVRRRTPLLLRFQARLHGRFQMVHAFVKRRLQPREPLLVIAHLRPENNVPDLVDPLVSGLVNMLAHYVIFLAQIRCFPRIVSSRTVLTAAYLTLYPSYTYTAGLELFPPGQLKRHADRYFLIGQETLCGDPLFADPLQPGFPVYTAMAELGAEDRELIAISLEAFFDCLALLPPRPGDPRVILDQIDARNQETAGLSFWAALLGLEEIPGAEERDDEEDEDEAASSPLE